VANTHSDFFKGQAERCLFYLPKHSEETQLALQEKEKKVIIETFISASMLL
jgi:hypothetical protein